MVKPAPRGSTINNANGEVKCAGRIINKTFDNIYLDNNISNLGWNIDYVLINFQNI